MRRKSSFAVVVTIALLLLCVAGGCGGKEVADTENRTPDSTTPSDLDDYLQEQKTFATGFDLVEVSLDLPAEGEDAEMMRQTMSQSPPYLLGRLTVTNNSGEIVHYYDFTPVLVYEDGTRDEGELTVLFETDMVAPGESLDALFRFSHSSLDGLREVLIRRGEVERQAVPAE